MKRDTMQRVYLRLEPTVDSVVKKNSPLMARLALDVVAYTDESYKTFKYRWPWKALEKPRHGCDTVNFQGYIWRAVWAADAAIPAAADSELLHGECPNCGADIPKAEMEKPCWDCGALPPPAAIDSGKASA